MDATFVPNRILLVTFPADDPFSDGHAVIQNPRVVKLAGVACIEGNHSEDSAETVRGKRVVVPVASVTSITEFESAEEAQAHLA
jgi:hypothetical protein